MPGLVPDRGDQRDQRVVGDQRPRLEADAPHHALHHLPVVGAIDAGHPQGDGRRRQQAIADDAVHHRVQGLLDLELPRRLQVGAAGARLVEDAAFEVGEQAHRLGAARVETDHVRRVGVGAHGSGATIQSERCVSGRRPDEPEWAPCSRSSCSPPRPEPAPPPPRSAAPPPRRPRRSAAQNSQEIRALWVLRGSLTRPDRIDRLVTAAARSGFNTLLLQVRGRGDAYYDSAIEPRGTGVAGTFDPLAYAIAAAGKSGPARARLVQHQPGGEHGDAADEPHPRRQRAPGVADGAAADRGRPGEARAASSALRAAAGRVDAAQRRGRRRPVRLAGDAGRRPVRRARRQRHRHALPRVGRPSRLHPLSVEPVRPQPGVAARLPRVDAARARPRPIGGVSTIGCVAIRWSMPTRSPSAGRRSGGCGWPISWPASAARSIGPGPTRSSRPR